MNGGKTIWRYEVLNRRRNNNSHTLDDERQINLLLPVFKNSTKGRCMRKQCLSKWEKVKIQVAWWSCPDEMKWYKVCRNANVHHQWKWLTSMERYCVEICLDGLLDKWKISSSIVCANAFVSLRCSCYLMLRCRVCRSILPFPLLVEWAGHVAEHFWRCRFLLQLVRQWVNLETIQTWHKLICRSLRAQFGVNHEEHVGKSRTEVSSISVMEARWFRIVHVHTLGTV